MKTPFGPKSNVMELRYHVLGRVDWYPAGAATALQPVYPTYYMILASHYCQDFCPT